MCVRFDMSKNWKTVASLFDGCEDQQAKEWRKQKNAEEGARKKNSKRI